LRPAGSRRSLSLLDGLRWLCVACQTLLDGLRWLCGLPCLDLDAASASWMACVGCVWPAFSGSRRSLSQLCLLDWPAVVCGRCYIGRDACGARGAHIYMAATPVVRVDVISIWPRRVWCAWRSSLYGRDAFGARGHRIYWPRRACGAPGRLTWPVLAVLIV